VDVKFDSISFPIQTTTKMQRTMWQRHERTFGDADDYSPKPATSIEAHEKMNTRDGEDMPSSLACALLCG
tara:strand:- start:323 stop:532 length:210 start_codon:yes stop_codon:yes gene_type:complete